MDQDRAEAGRGAMGASDCFPRAAAKAQPAAQCRGNGFSRIGLLPGAAMRLYQGVNLSPAGGSWPIAPNPGRGSICAGSRELRRREIGWRAPFGATSGFNKKIMF